MSDRITQFVRRHRLKFIAGGMLIVIAMYPFFKKDTTKSTLEQQMIATDVRIAPVDASLLPTESMKKWVLGVVSDAVEKKTLSIPKKEIITTVYQAAADPAPIQNTYVTNTYPTTILGGRSSPAPTISYVAPSVTFDGNVSGALSVAGLITASGGLDLAGGILSNSGLSFTLPTISDTLVGATDAVTLTNKTLSGIDNTINDLGVGNFTTDAISQWTNDLGLITAQTTDTLTNKTISGLNNIFADIPNSATSALATNIANAIVTRDASGNFEAGTITANLTGTASNALTAASANLAAVATIANSVTNGLYSTGSYTNPSWITSIDGSKLSGIVTASAIAAGTYGINITGNAASASVASVANTVVDGLYATSAYTNPSWLTSIDGSKLTGTVTASALAAGNYAINVLGNAGTVTNGVYTTGTYTNPLWITSLDGSKLSGTVTASALSAGTYTINILGNASTVTNGLYSTGSYANPSWLTSVDGSKLVGTITANALAAGTYAANISGNAGTVTNGLYSTGTYSNPSWLTSVDAGKLTGTITATALAVGDYVVNNISANNTVTASGVLANTLLSGTCAVNLNALGLAAFQSSATITTSQIFYNSTRNRHSRITSVNPCTDSGGNQWRVLTLTDSITGSVAGDSYTIYTPTGSIGTSGGGFFNNLYTISLKGLVSTLSGGFDVAEQYQTTDDTIEPGDVVMLDPTTANFIAKTRIPYEGGVIGVVSTNPGLTLGDETVGTWRKIALNGHVPVKVSTENGPIGIGDPLTASSLPGVAMKATETGAVIGKAMEPYIADGVGNIEVFVATGTYAPHTPLLQALSDTMFIKRPSFGTDTGGFAVIASGSREVHIPYDEPYTEIPVVSVTLSQDTTDDMDAVFSDDVRYGVVESTTEGFTIRINNERSHDTRFSWTAFLIPSAKTTRSLPTEIAQPFVNTSEEGMDKSLVEDSQE